MLQVSYSPHELIKSLYIHDDSAWLTVIIDDRELIAGERLAQLDLLHYFNVSLSAAISSYTCRVAIGRPPYSFSLTMGRSMP